MFKMFLLLQMVLLVFLSSCSDKASENKEKEEIVFPSAMETNKNLGHGINLGNALDAPKEGEWGVTLKEEYFQIIADSGFETVRIPVRWSTHADSNAPFTIDPEFMSRVKWAVDQALSRDLNVVLNMHHYTQMMADPSGQEERFYAMWKQIAKAFDGYSPKLVLEILNEPKDSLDAEEWNTLLANAIDTIRSIQPHRTLMVGTAPWGGIDGLSGLKLPNDSNLIVTVHYYEPHQFTHQGAEFEAGSEAWLGKTWRATPAQRSAIDNTLQLAADWGKENNRPIYLGEFGTYFKVDSVSRSFYTEYLVRRMDSLGISWAAWNFSSDFGILIDSTDEIHGYLTQALLHPGNNLALDSAINAGTNIDLKTFVLLDDFEGHDDYKGLPVTAWSWIDKNKGDPDSSNAHWYGYYNPESKMESPDGVGIVNILDLMQDSTLSPNFEKAIGKWGYAGYGIHLVNHLKGDAYPFIGFGTGFTGWDKPEFYYDLCKMTAVAFRAKGKGVWAMQLITDTVDNHYDPGKDWGNFQMEFSLTENWEEYVIPADELIPKPWSPQEQDMLKWSDACKHTNAIEFQNGQIYGEAPDAELEIYVDDIRFIGITELKENPPVWE